MGFYKSRVFPLLVDILMSADNFSTIRRDLLSEVQGNTLEIGFGTGLNLEHYPPSLTELTAIDSNPAMKRRAAPRIRASRAEVSFRTLDGESLPFAEGTFDTAVSTWTLCSIPDVRRALGEVHRVLKPGGRLFFVEHGLSDESGVRTWQHRMTPLQKRIADGCHLDRNIAGLLVDAHFFLETLDTFYMEGTPRIGGFLYKGVAVRSD